MQLFFFFGSRINDKHTPGTCLIHFISYDRSGPFFAVGRRAWHFCHIITYFKMSVTRKQSILIKKMGTCLDCVEVLKNTFSWEEIFWQSSFYHVFHFAFRSNCLTFILCKDYNLQRMFHDQVYNDLLRCTRKKHSAALRLRWEMFSHSQPIQGNADSWIILLDSSLVVLHFLLQILRICLKDEVWISDISIYMPSWTFHAPPIHRRVLVFFNADCADDPSGSCSDSLDVFAYSSMQELFRN